VGFRPLFFLSTPSSESIFETTFKLNWFWFDFILSHILVWLSFAAILHCFVLHFSGLQRSSAERIVQSMTGPYYVFEDNESSLYRLVSNLRLQNLQLYWVDDNRFGNDYVVDLFVIIFIALNSPVFHVFFVFAFVFPRLLNYLCLQCLIQSIDAIVSNLLSHVWHCLHRWALVS